MHPILLPLRAVLGLAFLVALPTVAGADSPFVFRDTGDETGLFPSVTGIQGHGAGWGDVDGDGLLDLYVGTFHKEGTKPNLLFRQSAGKFRLDDQKAPAISSRTTGVVFADFDNDGDLDLYVASMPQPKTGLVGCTLLSNDGHGGFTDVSKDNGACPPAFGGRSATVLDYDGDGLLDLLVGEDPLPGYNGSPTKSSRLFRNLGGLKFEDASRAAGLPVGVPGLGVAAADVNGDGWPDFFLASAGGGNVLFLNDGHGKFRECPGSRETFAWPAAGGDNMVCGIAFGDVNRDGWPDVLIGQHFEKPWQEPVANRLFLHRGLHDGVPKYEDISTAAGLKPLPIKAPHVEFQDFDNDGWPDLSASIVKFKDGRPYPLIYRHLGLENGLPHFREDTLAVNDFPTAEDRAISRAGELFTKAIKEGKIIYMAPGPSADYDNDGRLDFFLPSWWPEARSRLLHNETPGGHWLQVQVEGRDGVNRMGIGARVKIYRARQLGKPAGLLGSQEISVGFGYASGHAAIAHFGLGTETAVDVEITLPHGKGTRTREGLKADQRVMVK
jgi:hypothetical protein